MSRIEAVTDQNIPDESRVLLAKIQKKDGSLPNMFRVMAHSPAVLQAFIDFSQALDKHGALPKKHQEMIAVAVSENNVCDYCLSAHAAVGKSEGLSEADIAQARDLRAVDPKAEAALRFAASLIENRGQVGRHEHTELRRVGYKDAEILEIVATTVLNIFSNYINLVANTDIDFPVLHSRGEKLP